MGDDQLTLDRIERKVDSLMADVATIKQAQKNYEKLEERVSALERTFWKAFGGLIVLGGIGQLALQLALR